MSQNASSGYIFHRTREQPAPDPNSPPLKQIKFYLDRYKIKEALQIFFHGDTLRLLKDEPDFMWDIIPLICQRLRGLCQYRFRVFEGCEKMLCRIAVDENCNPKEVLISLLAEISQPASSYLAPDQQNENQLSTNNEEDDNVFRAMIRPLEGTLLRMNEPKPRGENYRWSLKVLMRHVGNISLPAEDKVDGKIRFTLPNEPRTKRYIEVLPLVLSFIEDFSEVESTGSDDGMKSPMPILTKSQIDEVLNGELATGESSEAEDDQEGHMNDGERNHLEDIDFDFATNSKIITPGTTTTFGDIVSDKNIEADDEDDMDNFFDDLSSGRGDITDASVTALISLMRRPLTFLDLTNYCSDLRLCANRCLNILLEQVPNLFAPLYKRVMKINMLASRSGAQLTSSTIDDYLLSSNRNIYARRRSDQNHNTSTIHHTPESTLSLATCSYIFRCERAAQNISQSFPQILTPETMLFCYTPYIIALLERPEVLAQEKGLSLLESILTQIERDSLDHDYLELFEQSSIFRNLCQIMVYSRMYTNRRCAYDLFSSICDLLTHDCKVKVFKKVLNQLDMRPCVRAACIDQYRKHLTIICKEIANLHQKLSFAAAWAKSTGEEHGLIQQQMNNTSGTEIGRDKHQAECNPSTLLHNLTGQTCTVNDLIPTQVSASSLGDASVQQQQQVPCNETQEARIMAISEDIMRRINMWQARYNVFGGKTLVDFLDQCIRACLPDGQHTDLIDNYELLLATLTIFRYLKLRKTMIKDETEDKYLNTEKLKKSFFEPVRSAISLIMTELKSHQKELVSNNKKSSTIVPPMAVGTVDPTVFAPNNSTTNRSKNSKKKSKANNNAQQLLGNAAQVVSTKTVKLEKSNGHDDPSMLAYPVDLSSKARINADKIIDQVEQFESTLGNLKTDLDEVDCINWVMCRIDLIESVLVRTCDLYDC